MAPDKKNIDRLVAFLLSMPEAQVSQVTRAFLHQVMQHMIAEGQVQLSCFGRFTLRKKNCKDKPTPLRVATCSKTKNRKEVFLVRHKHCVYFSQAPMFKDLIRAAFGPGGALVTEEGMQKYGVDEEATRDETADKTAATRYDCPQCGGKLEKHGNVSLCETCGSKPFEAQTLKVR